MATNFELLQPNFIHYEVGGKWVGGQPSTPPGASRMRKDYTLKPGTRYRRVHNWALNGKRMDLPNGQPALLYSPPMDATEFGQPISNPGIAPGSEVVNQQPVFNLGNPAEEYWFEVEVTA